MEKTKCTRCKGTGYDPKTKNKISSKLCLKCKGYGKLDWLEQILGGKDFPFDRIKMPHITILEELKMEHSNGKN